MMVATVVCSGVYVYVTSMHSVNVYGVYCAVCIHALHALYALYVNCTYVCIMYSLCVLY